MGRATSPGLVMGRAFIYLDRFETWAEQVCEIKAHQIADELLRIELAIKSVRQDLHVSAQRIEACTDSKLAAIFQAHDAILEDASLLEEIRKEVEHQRVSAPHALARVFKRWEEKFRTLESGETEHLADDVADLSRRLLREIAGVQTSVLEKMPAGRVLVARRLLPSDTVALPRRAVAGIVLECGGPGSHASLLARALGIPTVAQVPEVTERIDNGDCLVVDGDAGEVTVNPEPDLEEACRQRMRRVRAGNSLAKRAAHGPAFTADGVSITVVANVGCAEDVRAAVELGAEGVGLYRFEQFYLTRKMPPTPPELLDELRRVFAPMPDKLVTVRLLDMGGDKPVPFLRLPQEDNPFLGRRGVRLLLDFPELLAAQLKALLDFSLEREVRILVPMVTLAAEVAQVRHQLQHLAQAQGIQRLPPLGAMIETPAAALTVPEILRQADFLSVGTNDLTQYTMAADRESRLVDEYFIEDHPAVLRLLQIIIQDAGAVPLGICGELAGQIQAVPILVKLGIRCLSVAPPLIPGVKEAVRQSCAAPLRACA